MKRLYQRLLFLVVLLVAGTAGAQPMLTVDLSISPHPSTQLSDWSSRRETARLYVTNSSASVVEAKIEAKLSLNGTLIAASKTNIMPVLSIPKGVLTLSAEDIFPENAVTFYGDLRTSTMRSGILPEGNYELCITLIDAQSPRQVPITTQTCRTFGLMKNILPTLLQPEDNARIISGAQKLTLFSWTPMIPPPPTATIYRLRVTEVLPGQSAQQAFYSNRPLFERTTTGITQMLWPQDYPLPNKGAALAWGVQPEDEHGTPLVLPERFTNAFNLLVLPTSDECARLSDTVILLRNQTLKLEEEYWESDFQLQRVSQLLEEAEERADALSTQKLKLDQSLLNAKLERMKVIYDGQKARYDASISAFEKCLGR